MGREDNERSKKSDTESMPQEGIAKHEDSNVTTKKDSNDNNNNTVASTTVSEDRATTAYDPVVVPEPPRLSATDVELQKPRVGRVPALPDEDFSTDHNPSLVSNNNNNNNNNSSPEDGVALGGDEETPIGGDEETPIEWFLVDPQQRQRRNQQQQQVVVEGHVVKVEDSPAQDMKKKQIMVVVAIAIVAALALGLGFGVGSPFRQGPSPPPTLSPTEELYDPVMEDHLQMILEPVLGKDHLGLLSNH